MNREEAEYYLQSSGFSEEQIDTIEKAFTSTDAISRQAVLDAIDVKAWEFCDYLISKNRNDEQKPVSHFADNLRECVREELPSVNPQPKTGWIPVSERLPEENGFYLATCDGEICGEDQPFTGLAEFENGKWVDDEDDYQCVLAWMPLPKRYEPQESEDKE